MRRAPIRLLATLILTFALLAIGRTAHAATVTTTQDSGPGSLREALANAAPGETITFDLSCTVCTIELTSGVLVIDTDVTISGPGAQRLFIDANGLSRVLTMTPGVTADIGGVYVTGGNSQMEDDHIGSGGGIWVQQGTLTLRNVAVNGNHADHGGGIFFDGALTVIESEISENTALSVGAGIHGLGMLTVTNSRFVGNRSRWGAGVYVERGTLSMTGSTLTDNDASREGGALYILGSDQSTIVDTTLRGNRADSGAGGGVFSAGNVAIIKCTISGNVSGGVLGGGGVYSAGSLTVVNSTISGNSSEEAGRGGGISIPSGSATIVNSTIVLNGEGGVRNQNATFALSNTIVAGNTTFDVSGSIDTAQNNLIGDVMGVDVSSIIELTLADNGGPTQTHALVANGPAIGAGNNASVPADAFDLDSDGNTTEPIPFDQRGQAFPRLVAATVDIGAVEAACPVITITPSPLPNGTVGASYSQQLSANGGQSPHTFSAPSLPAGLTLSSDGLLSGMPTTAGTYTIALTVTEDGGCSRTVELTLTVVEDTTCGIVVGPATLQTPYVATLYYQPLSASPSGQYTFSVSAGALPPGLHVFKVGNNSFIGGFPTTPGTYQFTIKAKKKDSPCESTRSYTATIPKTVAPQLSCVVKTGNKQYTARFGYDNTTGGPVTVPIGSDNYFTPGNQNRGQVTVFQPGRVTNAFSVTFTVSGNNSDLAIWFLKGPDGVKRPVNITTATFPCP